MTNEPDHKPPQIIIYETEDTVATRFRQWATARLREYIVKGFTMDDARLKEFGGGGYWKELLDRARIARARADRGGVSGFCGTAGGKRGAKQPRVNRPNGQKNNG